MEEEVDAIVKKIKSRKAAGFNKIPLHEWKTRKFDNILQLCNPVYEQNNREINKSLHFSLPEGGQLQNH